MATALNFTNLPLIEAAVRASLNTRLSLTYTMVAEIQAKLGPDFPDIQVPTQLEVAPGFESHMLEIGPSVLPGVKFTAKNGISVVIQPQVIVVRWNRRLIRNATEYPRYATLQQAISIAIEAIRQLSEGFTGIRVANMSYINFIPTVDPAGSFMARYINPAAHVPMASASGRVRKVEASWMDAEEIDVRFSVDEAKLEPGAQIGYTLTTAAGTLLEQNQNAMAGLDRVHERLQAFFSELISEDAKREWGLRTNA